MVAQKLYDDLMQAGIDCLFDDRLEASVGSRLADADLIGVPWRVIISPKTLEKKSIEVKHRSEKEAKMMTIENFSASL